MNLSAYVLAHYDHPTLHLCTLCGNCGFIDTRGLRSPAGVECGRVNFCLCRNGRDHRRHAKRCGYGDDAEGYRAACDAAYEAWRSGRATVVEIGRKG